jgi:5-methylcytosine-specific restriction endonuclease McrA
MDSRQNNRYRTIKELVFDFVGAQKGCVEPEKLGKRVLAYFPDSAWKDSHWAYYRSQICTGKYADQFSESIKQNLSKTLRKRGQSRDRVKEHGDRILRQTRQLITEAASDDVVLRFKINRWVYSRLQQDEKQKKTPLKKSLWDAGVHACQRCGKPFASLRGVHLHRIDASKNYYDGNCQLLCSICHDS